MFIYKKFKNGRMYAYEFSGTGVEEVEYEYSDDDELVGKDSNAVYAVIDNADRVVKYETSFYFKKDFAVSIINQLNNFVGKNKKPYRVKKMYLIDLTIKR